MSPYISAYNGSHKRRRGLEVFPAKPQDVRRLVDIEFHAFEDEQVNQVLSFRDHKKPAHLERSVSLYEAALSSSSPKNKKNRYRQTLESNDRLSGMSEVCFRKVVLAETGEIISFCKFERKKYSEQELSSPADSGHEAEPKMNRDWYALNEQLRRDYNGSKEHYYIAMLATQPKHQHNGAATLLLEEILADADDFGIQVYLESTDTAKPLYEKLGFETVQELRFDPAHYGVKGLGIERQTVMVRNALGRSCM